MKESLLRLRKESLLSKKAAKKDQQELAKRVKQTDNKIVWHHWSDGRRTLIPFRAHDETLILILGDGDFSFSRSLLHSLPGEQLLCTVYDDEETVLRKYPAASENIRVLREASARLMFDFDATKLSLKYLTGKLAGSTPLSTINRIVFNFPHTGEGIKDRDYNIRAQQRLILAFFQAAATLLAELGDLCKDDLFKKDMVTRKTLMATASNTEDVTADYDPDVLFQPEIHLTCWTGDPYDDWNVKRLAASVPSLALLESFSFDFARYTDYQHCRTIGHVENDATFIDRPARTFVFAPRTFKQK